MFSATCHRSLLVLILPLSVAKHSWCNKQYCHKTMVDTLVL